MKVLDKKTAHFLLKVKESLSNYVIIKRKSNDYALISSYINYALKQRAAQKNVN
jgi:hypothetical protein